MTRRGPNTLDVAATGDAIDVDVDMVAGGRGRVSGNIDEASAQRVDVGELTVTVTSTANPVGPASEEVDVGASTARSLGSAVGNPEAMARLPLLEVPLANYQVIGEHGRGGIGVVHRARDRRLDREVAIKELQHNSHEARLRFEREMRTTAKLQHPGVVPVHEAGCWPDGSPFYAMKLVNGRSLKAIISETRTLADRLALLPQVVAVAETIAYAHSLRILHRDLKPSNVIVGSYGETVVIDWGLAKDLDEPSDVLFKEAGPYRECPDEGLTMQGQVLGTPAYMPPEQAQGVEVDQRADIYSLGAILYHALTGEPPYRGRTSTEILRELLAAPPVAVEERDDQIPEDLAAIVRKAMARDSKDRYPRAAEMAADLRSFQTGHLVDAHVYSSRELLARWMRKHRASLAVAALALVVLVVATGVYISRVVEARAEALRLQRTADQRSVSLAKAESVATARANDLIMSEATRALRADPARAIAVLASYPSTGAENNKVFSMAFQAIRSGLPTRVQAVGAPAVMAHSPNGKMIAVVGPQGAFVLDSESLEVRARWTLGLTKGSALSAIRWRGDAAFYVGTMGGEIAEYPLGGSAQIWATGCGGIWALDLSSSGAQLGAACADGRLWLRGSQDGTVTLAGSLGEPLLGTIYADDAFVTLASSGTLRTFGVDGKAKWQLELPHSGEGYLSMAYDREGGSLAIGTAGGDLLLVTLRSRTFRKVAIGRFSLTSLQWSSSGHFLVVVDAAPTVSVVDHDGKLVAQVSACVGTLLDEDMLVAGTVSGHLVYYSMATRARTDIEGGAEQIVELETTGSGSTAVVSLSLDGTLRKWPSSLSPVASLPFVGVGASLRARLDGPGFVMSTDHGTVSFVGNDGRPTSSLKVPPRFAMIPLGAHHFAAYRQGDARVILYDKSGVELSSVDIGAGIRRLRTRGESVAIVSSDGRLFTSSIEAGNLGRSLHVLPPGCIATDARWVKEDEVLVSCSDSHGYWVNLLSDRSTPLQGLDGTTLGVSSISATEDGVAYVATNRGDVLEAKTGTRLVRCAAEPLLRAASRGIGLTVACDDKVFVVNGHHLDGPLPLGADVDSLDLDASAASLTVGLGHDLIVWRYHEGSLQAASLPGYIYEIASLGEGVVAAASGAGLVQVWKLDDMPRMPTGAILLRAWLNKKTWIDNYKAI